MNYIKQLNAFYDWLETNSLNSSCISLWHALLHTCNKAGWPQEFAVAIKTLELKTGMERRTIERARNTLKQKGLIDWRSRKGNQSAVYSMVVLYDKNVSQDVVQYKNDAQPVVQPVAQSVAQPVAINKQNKTKQNNNIGFLHETNLETDTETEMVSLVNSVDPSLDQLVDQSLDQSRDESLTIPKHKQKQNNNNGQNEYTPEFEEFWKHYPRKVGKREAFAKWKARLKQGETPERLLQACINYAKECERLGTEEKFIKHGKTFLSDKKPYEDYLDVANDKPNGQAREPSLFDMEVALNKHIAAGGSPDDFDIERWYRQRGVGS